MKKFNFKSFLCGVLAAAVFFTLGTVALAVSGRTVFGTVNIQLNGKQVGRKGETYALANGARAPYSISYIDEKNGGTTYLPVRKISELLGVEVDFDGATGTVLLGNNLIEYKPISGLTLSLPKGYNTYYDSDNCDCYLENGKVVVTVLKEAKSDINGAVGREITLKEYGDAVARANGLDSVVYVDSYGNYYLTYERTVEGQVFFYYAVVKESGSNFWLFNFACLKSEKDVNVNNFGKWAGMIKVS